MILDAKQTALENAMRKIEKDFGKGAIMRLGDIADKMNLEVISSGSLAVDLAVGVGGYPRGRVIEIYGPESSGKTTLALHAIASAQKNGGIAASSMPNTPSIRSMPATLASTPTNCSFPSRITANRPLKSQKNWSAAVLSMSSSSTPLPPWSRKLKSKAKWATLTSASRPAS